jgi:hypothetical protein
MRKGGRFCPQLLVGFNLSLCLVEYLESFDSCILPFPLLVDL